MPTLGRMLISASTSATVAAAARLGTRPRVVMMTVRSTAYDKDLTSALGAYDDLSKPRDVLSLRDLVHRATRTRSSARSRSRGG